MKRYILLFTILFSGKITVLYGQQHPVILEDLVEHIAENSEEELDYTELYQSLQYYTTHPINLNKTNQEELQQLYLLNTFQIEKLLAHIKKNGPLLSYLELQSVSGFDLQSIQNIQPFITTESIPSSKVIFSKFEQFLLFRDQFYLQKQKGFIPDENGEIYYLGNAQKQYTRYQLKNKFLQFGILGEKDAGESFFGKTQPYGFDYLSAHLQLKEIGKIKNLVLGDYQLHFGQGLTIYTGMSFGKSSEVIQIQKTGNTIRPHTSTEENLFFRGLALELEPIKNWSITTFFSNHKTDANITDTLLDETLVFSSVNGSGLHRTDSELKDKNAILQNHFGLHSNYKYQNLSLGISYYHTKLEGNYQKAISAYNQFEFADNSNQNFGVNYQLLYKNMLFFGEAAMSQNRAIAHIDGIMMALDKTLSACLLVRNYPKEYQSQFANAFSESKTQNEKGIYLGLEYTPNHKLKIKTYADIYEFPWLKYQVNFPSSGNDFFSQANYSFSKKTKFYVRYKTELVEENTTSDARYGKNRKDNIRFHLDYNEGEKWNFSNRIESITYRLEDYASRGFLIYQDVKYRPILSKFTFSGRYAIFNTSDYNSRVYSYEDDMLYAYSIPAYYGKGSKFYFVCRYSIIKNLDIWFRISHTVYTDRTIIKSGSDEINGNKISEVKLQCRYQF